jgi:hypothetical protein
LRIIDLKDIHYSTYLRDNNIRDILLILVFLYIILIFVFFVLGPPPPPPPQCLFWICSRKGTYCALQKVLTHVLEEAGYTKNSHFTLPDFMKVRLFLLTLGCYGKLAA